MSRNVNRLVRAVLGLEKTGVGAEAKKGEEPFIRQFLSFDI